MENIDWRSALIGTQTLNNWCSWLEWLNPYHWQVCSHSDRQSCSKLMGLNLMTDTGTHRLVELHLRTDQGSRHRALPTSLAILEASYPHHKSDLAYPMGDFRVKWKSFNLNVHKRANIPVHHRLPSDHAHTSEEENKEYQEEDILAPACFHGSIEGGVVRDALGIHNLRGPFFRETPCLLLMPILSTAKPKSCRAR